MTLVAGIDSPTQSCKVVSCDADDTDDTDDADDGPLRRRGTAGHPDRSDVNPYVNPDVDPAAWWTALVATFGNGSRLSGVAPAYVNSVNGYAPGAFEPGSLTSW